MKLVLGDGYYPYVQKPVDYQPYRPIYLFRGPAPDAGFSYGLFEDEELSEQYYADLGLEPFSPFSGKPAKLVEEVSVDELKRHLREHLGDKLEECECRFCGAGYRQNIRHYYKGRTDLYCHRCGSKLVLDCPQADEKEDKPS